MRNLHLYFEALSDEERSDWWFREKFLPVMEEPDEFAFLLLWAKAHGWTVEVAYDMDAYDEHAMEAPVLGYRATAPDGTVFEVGDDMASHDLTWADVNGRPHGPSLFFALRDAYDKRPEKGCVVELALLVKWKCGRETVVERWGVDDPIYAKVATLTKTQRETKKVAPVPYRRIKGYRFAFLRTEEVSPQHPDLRGACDEVRALLDPEAARYLAERAERDACAKAYAVEDAKARRELWDRPS